MNVTVTSNLTITLPETLVKLHQKAYPGEEINAALLKLYLTACYGIVRINDAVIDHLLRTEGFDSICNRIRECMEEDCELCGPK